MIYVLSSGLSLHLQAPTPGLASLPDHHPTFGATDQSPQQLAQLHPAFFATVMSTEISGFRAEGWLNGLVV
jgi:hypothetical protein